MLIRINGMGSPLARSSRKFPFLAYRGSDAYVFVSYAHAEAERLRMFLVALHESGVNLWYDDGIATGAKWREELATTIERASALLFCHSKQASLSSTCRGEVSFALDCEIPTLCVAWDEVGLPKELQIGLSARQSVPLHTIGVSEGVRRTLTWLGDVLPASSRRTLRLPVSEPEDPFGPILRRYRIDDSRGADPDGQRAFDVQTRQTVRLRRLPEQSLTPGFLERLERYRSIRHSNLETIHELHPAQGSVVLVCEYVETETLHARGNRFHGDDVSSLGRVLSDVASALAKLHSIGLVHGSVDARHIASDASGRVVLLISGDMALVTDALATSDARALGNIGNECLKAGWRSSDSTHEEMERMVEALMNASNTDAPTLLRRVASLRTQSGFAFDSQVQPFIGRSKEIGQMRRAFGVERRTTPIVVAISGESGIGKTRLVEHFLESLAADAVVLRGRCHRHSSAPFSGFEDLNVKIADYLTRRDRADGVRPRNASALVRLFPIFSQLQGPLAEDDEGTDFADLTRIKQLAFLAFKELLGRIAEKERVAVWLDDFQWADGDSQLLLRALLEGVDAPGVQYILCFHSRAEVDRVMGSFVHESNDVERISLGPLSQAESYALGRSLSEASEVDDSRLERIVAMAEGSPFLIELLIDGFRSVAVTEANLDITTLLRDRISKLSAPERSVLELLSVAGSPLAADLVERLIDLPAQALSQLDWKRLIRYGSQTRGTIEIYHSRLRDAVLQLLEPGSRRVMHATLANALENARSDDYNALYFHCLNAGDTQRAFHYLLRAARAATDQLAFAHAVELYERALTMRDDQAASIYPELGRALVLYGQPMHGAEKYVLAASLAGSEPLAMTYRGLAAYHLELSGHFEQATRLIKPVLRFHRIPYPSTHRRSFRWIVRCVRVVKLKGVAFVECPESSVAPADLQRLDVMDGVARSLMVNDNIRGIYFAALSLLTALRIGEVTRVFRALDLADSAEVFESAGSGLANIASRLIDGHRGVAQRTEDYVFLGRTHISAAQKQVSRGRWREALVNCDEGTSLLARVPQTDWERNTATMLALRCLEELGDIEVMHSRANQFLVGAKERGDFYRIAISTLHAGYVLLAHDEVSLARAAADEVEQMWSGRDFHLQSAYIFRLRTMCDLYERQFDAAAERLQAFKPKIEEARFLRIPMVAIDFFQLVARMGLLDARTTSASITDDAITRLAAVPRDYARAHVELLRAGQCAAQDDLIGARQRLSSAAKLFETHEMRLYAAYANHRLGQIAAGGDGDTLVRSAGARLSLHGVVRPGKWLDLHAPGFARYQQPA